MKPSSLITNSRISSAIGRNLSPKLGSNSLTFSYIPGGGLPKSGSHIIYSDDISISDEEVIYPPSYSSYQTYSSPKLKDDDGLDFNENNYYWLVLHNYSGSNKYWKYYYDENADYEDGLIAWSWSPQWGYGVKWSSSETCPSQVPKGSIIMDLGWKDDDIVATATNESSIAKYGRHQKIVKDSNITSYAEALARAEAEVDGMEEIPRKGSVTINGFTGIKTNYQLSSNISKLGIGGLWEVVSYTHTINNQGFSTTINYGKQPFDVTKWISEVETEVENK